MGRRISEIRERLNEIAGERLYFNLREGVVDERINIGERETTFNLELEVYGRDEDTEMIIQLLLKNENNLEALSIYPIVGMGGLGKTTLAQLVYNDVRVVEYFDLRVWVYVSEHFDIKRLLNETIKLAGGDTNDLIDATLNPLKHRLQNILSGKRFLLVLDDVWIENQEQWDTIKDCLTQGAQGSSIVVTTRMERVARIIGARHTYHLTFLTEDICWSLFKKCAFGIGMENLNPNLVAIGKEIVKKCGGLPLAVKSLGSLLRFKSTVKEWLLVRDMDLWELDDEQVIILPALRLSYHHLSSQLRQCFAYCSIFPKDYVIEKEKLVHLWMANGFIQSKGRMELEDIGNEIFNDLLWRSFFENIEKDDDGNIISCKMHGLMNDLACSVMVDECSIMEVGKEKYIPKTVRHLSLIFDLESPSSPLESLLKSQLIHTLLSQSSSGEFIRDLDSVFSNLRWLRVLDLSHSEFRSLPISIGKLKHLRYLNLSYTSITALPESVSSLRNLQTLKLQCCLDLQKLPRDMRKMSSLRHLDINYCSKLTKMPIGMGELMHLQTLRKFIASQERGCLVKELQGLNHLKGELFIERLENVRDSMEAKEANLIGKQNLFTLGLTWSEGDDGEACFQENTEKVLEGLHPPPNIRVFIIRGYGAVEFPSWMVDLSLPNLVRVSITNCGRLEHLPPLGKLPNLKDLKIEGLNCVKYIGKEFYGDEGMEKGFPSLVELSISNMLNLEEWSKEEAEDVLPYLSKLVVKGCPKLTSLPLLSSLKHLEVWRCNEVILRSLGNLTSLSCLLVKFLEMKCFPEGVLQNLIALEYLTITLCDELTSLPEEIQYLTSLRKLNIWYCENLVSLEGLQYITTLQALDICGCPLLEIRCQRETGEDWHKIAHISSISIN